MAPDDAPSVSGRVLDRHATLTFTRSHKGSDMLYNQDQKILGVSIVIRFIVGLIPLALQYPCSLFVPTGELG
jgi:hypothetical protein